MALVEDGDYFALLGVARGATGYEVKRAYLELRRAFEPARVLTAQTADLVNDVKTIVEVLDEAYEILREPNRRERYRKAIEAGPP
jgi:curved DNA-binding protein CbpA